MALSKVNLVVRDPNRAYVSNMLYLPKTPLGPGGVQSVKDSLQFYVAKGNQMVAERLWEETRDHLIVPREFIKSQSYSDFAFDFVDLTPKTFPKSNLVARSRPRDNQKEAWEAIGESEGGILNLACGKGKTVLALLKAVELGCPVLIVVHNTTLYEQWKKEIDLHLELPFGTRIGSIQGEEFDWQQPITIAMIHSLSNRAEEGSLPLGFSQWFGAVFYDEVHHLSAPVFVKSAAVVTGQRFGLTATANRADGLQFIYHYHIGQIFHSDLTQDLIPKIYFQQTPSWLDLEDPDVCDKNGELNIPKMRSAIGKNEEANIFRYKCIKEALDSGRKIVCLSHSKAQLVTMAEMFPGSALIIQETPQAERNSMLRSSQIAFAIASLGFEGMDDDNLDTLFYLTPFSSENDLQQSMGRVQRFKENKKPPVVVIFEDTRIGPFRAMCHALRKILKNWDISYSTLQVPTFNS